MKDNVNLRATSLKEFWGNKYEENIFLWEGAKRNLKLYQINKIKDRTSIDFFLDHNKYEKSLKKCKYLLKKFFKYLIVSFGFCSGIK